MKENLKLKDQNSKLQLKAQNFCAKMAIHIVLSFNLWF
jgi:hypothetical protein